MKRRRAAFVAVAPAPQLHPGPTIELTAVPGLDLRYRIEMAQHDRRQVTHVDIPADATYADTKRIMTDAVNDALDRFQHGDPYATGHVT